MSSSLSSSDTSSPLSVDLESIASTLDGLASSATNPWTLLLKLGGQTYPWGNDNSDERSMPFHYTERGLAYDFEEDPTHEGALVMGNRFSSAGGDWPPAFDVVSGYEKQTWRNVALLCKEPLPRAHLLDLALSAGADSRQSHNTAREIASLYLDFLGKENLDLYYRASCLRRAWSLARQFGFHDLEQEARREAYGMTLPMIHADTIIPGTICQFFEILTVEPRNGKFVDPDQCAVQIALKYLRSRTRQNEELAEIISDLLVRVASSDVERDEARRSLIEGYIDLANDESGIRAAVWYERAVAEARRYGYTDLHDRAVQALQEHPLREEDMQKISIDMQIPCYVTDARLAAYRQSRNILEALEIWLTTFSPTGCREKNFATAKKEISGTLLSHVSRTRYDQNGLPVRTTFGLEGAEQECLELIELMNAGAYGNLLANELIAFKTEYNIPSLKRISDHLVTTYRCDSKLAACFAEALDSFWSGRYGDASRIAFPLIEAGMRGLLLMLGDPLYRVQTGNSDGRFPSLETYTQRLEIYNFDPDWLRCIRNPVAKWRNALAHGHIFWMSREKAAILLRVAALFVVLTPDNATERGHTEISERLWDPLKWAANQANLEAVWREEWMVSWKRSSLGDNG